MCIIKISKNLKFSKDRMKIYGHFVKYCIRALRLKRKYKVYIVDDRHKYRVETTAVFTEEDQCIVVYGKGRAFVDILRSTAHELVHAKQCEKGEKLVSKILHFNNKFETEANSVSGDLLNAYTDVMGHDRIYEN